MRETDGGFIVVAGLLILAAVSLGSCTTNITIGETGINKLIFIRKEFKIPS